jgi:hypothetical protein
LSELGAEEGAAGAVVDCVDPLVDAPEPSLFDELVDSAEEAEIDPESLLLSPFEAEGLALP